MKLIRNSGNDRVVDELRECLIPRTTLDVASPEFSLFAFGEIRDCLTALSRCRLVLPLDEAGDLSLLGSAADRSFRNRLQTRWLAKQCAAWLDRKTEVRRVGGVLPQILQQPLDVDFRHTFKIGVDYRFKTDKNNPYDGPVMMIKGKKRNILEDFGVNVHA